MDGQRAAAQLPTPGDNEKCYLAGSLHWRTGALFETVGPKRDGAAVRRDTSTSCGTGCGGTRRSM